MSVLHILMAITIACIWGVNFVAIKLSYAAFTPFALLFIRFLFSVFPWIFFIPKPSISWQNIFYVSFFLWIGQLSFMFLGIYLGASPGIASLVLQSQSIFTLILSMIFLHYKPTLTEIIGISIAFIGITIIAVDRFYGDSFLGLMMIIPSAFSVSCSNILFSKNANTTDHPLSMVVWTSVIPPIPMLLLSLYFEGVDALPKAFECMDSVVIGSICYTVLLSTLFATSMWTVLLRYYNPAVVVPYLLLIPVFGMATTTIVLNEHYSSVSLWAGGLILGGLGINQLSKYALNKRKL